MAICLKIGEKVPDYGEIWLSESRRFCDNGYSFPFYFIRHIFIKIFHILYNCIIYWFYTFTFIIKSELFHMLSKFIEVTIKIQERRLICIKCFF